MSEFYTEKDIVSAKVKNAMGDEMRAEAEPGSLRMDTEMTYRDGDTVAVVSGEKSLRKIKRVVDAALEEGDEDFGFFMEALFAAAVMEVE